MSQSTMTFDDELEEICGETMEHDIDYTELCEDGTTYWHCRRCGAEGYDDTVSER